jgi:2-dehydropantoate 2-reductase
MDRIETVSLVGLGGIGSAYLSVISENIPMRNIRVIAGGERGARHMEHGVVVNGRTFRFPVYDPGREAEPSDLVIFAVKQYQLEGAMNDARRHIGPGTVIMSFLNGIKSEKIVGDVYGSERVLYSFVPATNAVRNGNSVEYDHLGPISFGEAVNSPGARSEMVERVADFFSRAGVRYKIPEDMIKAIWKKFMINVGLNQVEAVLRCSNSVVQDVKSVRDLVISAMKEVVAVSKAEGTGVTEDDIPRFFEGFDRSRQTGKTSMLQDVEAGRGTEVDILGGEVLALAEKHGIETPVNVMLVRLIKAMEDMANPQPASGRA